jgi:hypothetical protein
MQKLKIKTTRWPGGYKAWLSDDPKTRSTSTRCAWAAAYNLAVKVFFGHNHLAQLDPAELDKTIVTQTSQDTYLATYDK